jgi:putative phosphoesterase
MRIAIVSDIHGNLTALEAVISDLKQTSPDLVLHGGDLAANGHRSAEVIDRIRELEWAGVHGNTDQMLWAPETLAEVLPRAPKIRCLLDVLFNSIAPATRDLLGENRLEWLRKLPREWRSRELLLLHASPNNLWQAPMPDCDQAGLAQTYGGCGAAMVVYGHIHRPYVRRLPHLVVANSGSAGTSYDGDARAAYLLIEDTNITIRRVEYDVESEVKDLLASNYPNAAWLAEIRRRGQYVPIPRR